MTAPTLKAILLGVEARLATIAGLRTSAIVPEAISPPHALVGLPPIPTYRSTMSRGTYELDLTVTVLVSAGISRIGQMMLADYASVSGALSIPLAIEADRTLGGTVDDCVVTSFRPLGLDEVGVISYYGGVFNLKTLASGV
jgi:hypothetical protein